MVLHVLLKTTPSMLLQLNNKFSLSRYPYSSTTLNMDDQTITATANGCIKKRFQLASNIGRKSIQMTKLKHQIFMLLQLNSILKRNTTFFFLEALNYCEFVMRKPLHSTTIYNKREQHCSCIIKFCLAQGYGHSIENSAPIV